MFVRYQLKERNRQEEEKQKATTERKEVRKEITFLQIEIEELENKLVQYFQNSKDEERIMISFII